jgi:hypothetical protein
VREPTRFRRVPQLRRVEPHADVDQNARGELSCLGGGFERHAHQHRVPLPSKDAAPCLVRPVPQIVERVTGKFPLRHALDRSCALCGTRIFYS